MTRSHNAYDTGSFPFIDVENESCLSPEMADSNPKTLFFNMGKIIKV